MICNTFHNSAYYEINLSESIHINTFRKKKRYEHFKIN